MLMEALLQLRKEEKMDNILVYILTNKNEKFLKSTRSMIGSSELSERIERVSLRS